MTQEDVGAREIHPRPRRNSSPGPKKSVPRSWFSRQREGGNCSRKAGLSHMIGLDGWVFGPGGGARSSLGAGELGRRPLPGNARARSPRSRAPPAEEVGSESRDSGPPGGGAVGSPAGCGREGAPEGRARGSQSRTPAPVDSARN